MGVLQALLLPTKTTTIYAIHLLLTQCKMSYYLTRMIAAAQSVTSLDNISENKKRCAPPMSPHRGVYVACPQITKSELHRSSLEAPRSAWIGVTPLSIYRIPPSNRIDFGPTWPNLCYWAGFGSSFLFMIALIFCPVNPANTPLARAQPPSPCPATSTLPNIPPPPPTTLPGQILVTGDQPKNGKISVTGGVYGSATS